MNEGVLSTGNEVGDLAMGLYGPYKEVPYGSPEDMIKDTLQLVYDNSVVCEASFMHENWLYKLFCSADILRKVEHERFRILEEYELNEVKSSTEIKDVYLNDLAFQMFVAGSDNNGYYHSDGAFITKTNLIYINNNYVRHGDLELDKLFKVEDCSEEVRQRSLKVNDNVVRIREYMKQKEEPEHEIGPHCFDPYPCGFWGYCSRHLPSPNIFDISGRISGEDRWDLLKRGIVSFQDAKDAGILNEKQLSQVDHELGNLPPHIDKENIKDYLKDFTYPLYFLDFETFQPAIPLYDNSRPYQQIPFQYSLHWIEEEGGELHHKEYLAYPGHDHRKELAKRLCEDIPRNVCVVAYNMGFEKGRIRDLAILYPELSEHLIDIHDNMKDLMIPFQKGWYYTKAMQGSYSIKCVLPALFPDDPELDYHNLEGVQNGGDAMDMFVRMQEMEPEELEKSREQLLKYCCLDTYAMVKIFMKLTEVIY